MRHSQVLGAALALVALATVGACDSHGLRVHNEFLAMGTTVSIDVGGDAPADAQPAADAAQEELKRIGREWYPWGDAGELVQLNQALASGARADVSPELVELLQRAALYSKKSEGTFDPAVGGLVRLWGFDSADRGTKPAPTRKQLDAWRRDRPTLNDLVIEGLSVSSARRDLVLDLGAIGKGFAVDRAIVLLQSRGIRHALVNAGGNIRALSDGHAKPWRIAIRDPRAVRALAWLDLRGDEAVSTSGDYERVAFIGGRRVHHLLDPRTGNPAEHTVAVTVLAANATLADAASTAIFVAGPTRWPAIAKAMEVDQVLRIDADGTAQVTPKLRERLQFKSGETAQTRWQTTAL
jgi:thiamine biosynthesis lipoprotein